MKKTAILALTLGALAMLATPVYAFFNDSSITVTGTATVATSVDGLEYRISSTEKLPKEKLTAFTEEQQVSTTPAEEPAATPPVDVEVPVTPEVAEPSSEHGETTVVELEPSTHVVVEELPAPPPVEEGTQDPVKSDVQQLTEVIVDGSEVSDTTETPVDTKEQATEAQVTEAPALQKAEAIASDNKGQEKDKYTASLYLRNKLDVAIVVHVHIQDELDIDIPLEPGQEFTLPVVTFKHYYDVELSAMNGWITANLHADKK